MEKTWKVKIHKSSFGARKNSNSRVLRKNVFFRLINLSHKSLISDSVVSWTNSRWILHLKIHLKKTLKLSPKRFEMVLYSIAYNYKFYFDFRKDFGVRSSPRWLAVVVVVVESTQQKLSVLYSLIIVCLNL